MFLNRVEGYTRREVLRAKRCRKLLHDLSAPSYADINKMIRMNLIKNCPVGCADVKLAQEIFGKDVAVLKGKSVRPKPNAATKNDVIDLPSELIISETELAIDVVYVESEAFLHAIDRKIKAKSLVPLGTKKKADASDLLDGLKKIIWSYNRSDVRITMIHADNEFRSIEDEIKEDLKIPFNFANPDEHVGDIERENRVLEERFRVEYHRLPFLIFPRQMIRESLARITFNRNLVIPEEGCSEYYSPHQILQRRNVDYNKEFEFSFGAYVIARQETSPRKNNPKPRGRDTIYLRASKSLQGGHRVLDLATGKVIERPKCDLVVMTDLVVKRVEEMAKEQGLKSNKFFNRKREPLTPIDLLEGVADEEGESQDVSDEVIIDGGDPYQADLPSPVDPDPGGLLSDEDTLDPDDMIDDDEVAEILDDNIRNDGIPMEVDEDGNLYYVEEAVSDLDGGDINDEDSSLGNCDEEDREESLEPSLMSESLINERPTRERSAPARLNPATGKNYHQAAKSATDRFVKRYCEVLKNKEMVHNITAQVQCKEETLEYEEHESQMLAVYIDALCHNQQFILPKAIKEFGQDGIAAAKSELKQMHDRTCFRAMAVAELTRQEKERAMDGLMFVQQKKSGVHKGRLAYNGKPTRKWVSREDKSSPTCFTESILLTCGIDAAEHQDIITMDIPNAFVQTDMPKKAIGEQISMKIRGRLVSWLVEMNPLI